MQLPKKVIVLGSGAIKIGEAGEFDFSGSQCLKSLKEEGIQTVLVNPNIATIQTDEKIADRIYFLPVTPYFVDKIIEKEKPDAIMLGFGGQTALNCGVELHDSGILEKHNVRVLGTTVDTIKATEDRALFIEKLNEVELKAAKSYPVKSVDEAVDAAQDIGYPVMIRSAFALGGLGSAVCDNEEDLKDKANIAFSHTNQILVEEYLKHWKEIEYEVVRDKDDNCITVCNMENIDPMGIHTGDSIVVAPSQTLSNAEYHKLRAIAIKLIRHLGIVGECNIQYALDPKSEDYRIIEVNARLSRSSALASKATGYPLAYIAAKLGLGYSLIELQNNITKTTQACFEPALDYIVIKIPRWDLKKFRNVSRNIGSSMKSVGEVMAIGRTFEEAFQKALRMTDTGINGLVDNSTEYDLSVELAKPSDERILAVGQALQKGFSVDELHEQTGITKWFLHKMDNIVSYDKKLRELSWSELSDKQLRRAKQLGFSDKQLSLIFNTGYVDVKKKRDELGIKPIVKQIDTLAAEFPAKTNYLYLTYNATEDDIEFNTEKSAIVLGSGVYRIGSSVEFDWCCVNTVFSLKSMGYKAIMINYNPETVSTDYDVCDALYFEEISYETVHEIYEKENPEGVIISMGGQIANNIATKLEDNGVTLLGTSAKSIDNAEDRHKFSTLLDEIGIAQPQWEAFTHLEDAKKFAQDVEYPVLVRPSYVLSGAAMNVAFTEKDLETVVTRAARVNLEYPVVISKFMINSKEIELDAVAQNGKIVAEAISEHIENAGVHSGDATMLYPGATLYPETVEKIKKTSRAIAEKLNITGPFNIQFLAKDNNIRVIECNLRASRSFPFVSKVQKRNMIDIATRAILGEQLEYEEAKPISHLGIKSPQFSFARLSGADPITSVEMASTGEVACLGKDLNAALMKALLAAGVILPKKKILLSIGGKENKEKFMPFAKKLVELGFELFGTYHTAEHLQEQNIPCTILHKIREDKEPNVGTMIDQREIEMIINVSEEYNSGTLTDGYYIRRKAADRGIPLITNLQLAKQFVDMMATTTLDDLEIKAWNEY